MGSMSGTHVSFYFNILTELIGTDIRIFDKTKDIANTRKKEIHLFTA